MNICVIILVALSNYFISSQGFLKNYGFIVYPKPKAILGLISSKS